LTIWAITSFTRKILLPEVSYTS